MRTRVVVAAAGVALLVLLAGSGHAQTDEDARDFADLLDDVELVQGTDKTPSVRSQVHPTFNMVKYIRAKGYEAEHHKVQTTDGYILSLFRIVGSPFRSDLRPSLQPQLNVESEYAVHVDQPSQPPTVGTAEPPAQQAPQSASQSMPTTGFLGIENAPALDNMPDANPSSRPVMVMQHGLLGTCLAFAFNPYGNKPWSFHFFDQGYDVWLSNARGSSFSQEHATLYTSEEKYWDFTFDEMAAFDVPAVTAYVLKVSGAKTLTYVGHSQGTAMGYAAFTQFPTLAKHVNLFISVAPATNIQRHDSEMLRSVQDDIKLDGVQLYLGKKYFPSERLGRMIRGGYCKQHPAICDLPKLFKGMELSEWFKKHRKDILHRRFMKKHTMLSKSHHSFLQMPVLLPQPLAQPPQQASAQISSLFAPPQASGGGSTWSESEMNGAHDGQANVPPEELDTYHDVEPKLDVTSTKTLQHWVQMSTTNSFRHFQYATAAENIQRYGSEEPPQYRLENLMVPTYIVVGATDGISMPNMQWLLDRVKQTSLVKADVIPEFDHLQPLVHDALPLHVFPAVERVLRVYNPSEQVLSGAPEPGMAQSEASPQLLPDADPAPELREPSVVPVGEVDTEVAQIMGVGQVMEVMDAVQGTPTAPQAPNDALKPQQQQQQQQPQSQKQGINKGQLLVWKDGAGWVKGA